MRFVFKRLTQNDCRFLLQMQYVLQGAGERDDEVIMETTTTMMWTVSGCLKVMLHQPSSTSMTFLGAQSLLSYIVAMRAKPYFP